jgi:hypothetical protein
MNSYLDKMPFCEISAASTDFVPIKQSGNVRQDCAGNAFVCAVFAFLGDAGTIYVHPLEYPKSFRFAACEDFIATVTFIRQMNFKISVLENMGSGQRATRAHSNHS